MDFKTSLASIKSQLMGQSESPNVSQSARFIDEMHKSIGKLNESLHSQYNDIVNRYNHTFTKLLASNPSLQPHIKRINDVLQDRSEFCAQQHSNLALKKKTSKRKKKNTKTATTAADSSELKSMVENAHDLLANNTQLTKLSIKKEKVSCSFNKKTKKKQQQQKQSGLHNASTVSSSHYDHQDDDSQDASSSNMTKTIVKTEITLERATSNSSSKSGHKKNSFKKQRLLSTNNHKELQTVNETVTESAVSESETEEPPKAKSAKYHKLQHQTSQQVPGSSSQALTKLTVIPNTPASLRIIHNQVDLADTNSKTVKAAPAAVQAIKPMTRRAAAAAAAIAAEQPATGTSKHTASSKMTAGKVLEELTKTVSQSGKVKQMVEMHEARLLNKAAGSNFVPPTPASTSKQQQQQQPPARRILFHNQANKNGKNTAAATSALATSSSNTNKIRSSIDKRKQRVSQQKQKAESKRQSLKKVNAFIKDLSTNIKSEKLSLANITNDEDDEEESHTDDEFDTQSVKSEPVDPTNLKDYPATVKRLISASNSTIHQQYRVLNHPTENSKSATTTSATSSMRKSFTKFLERNTPSKLTRTELEEKRKAELACKERKEQERRAEREKQQQERIEISKRKREEKMRKIAEQKSKQLEEDIKKKEEWEAKCKEVEENKKRLLDERKREEYEKQQRNREQRAAMSVATPAHSKQAQPHITVTNASASHVSTYSNTHFKQANMLKPVQPINHHHFILNKPAIHGNTATHSNNSSSTNTYENLSTFKQAQHFQQSSHLHSTNVLQKSNILNLPNHMETMSKMTNMNTTTTIPPSSSSNSNENYNLSDLRSDDETDDEDEPSKPIPGWARDVTVRARQQCLNSINFTKLFKATCQNEIILDKIFTLKRKKFYERSSSANWDTPPIWTSGINGNESFRRLHN